MSGTKSSSALLGAAALLAIGGCGAERRNDALGRARATYQQTAGRPDVNAQAPVALHEASKSLQRAEQAFKDGEDEDDVNALSYVAERKSEVAIERAREKQAEAEMEQLAGQGERILVRQSRRPGSVGTGLFATGRADLTPGTKRRLTNAADILRGPPNERVVVVEGHTDSTGRPPFNQELSQRRAAAARDYLVEQGVGSERIVTREFGPSKPVASNGTAEGRQQNRRVEIIVQQPTTSNAATAGVGRQSGPPPAD
jgi:outer membrane protein OmpA-like peptidoglycan-associated protein